MGKAVVNITNIARLCHEANKALCMVYGDTSQVHWEDAPDWQKDSAMKGVAFVLDNPDVTSEQTHENWCKDKYEAGWVYGHIKDEGAKTHPCLVRYEELPAFQKQKDAIFNAIVKSFKSEDVIFEM